MSEESLFRALAAARAPARDNAFTLAVLERAEQERFKLAAFHSVLRGAGIAAAAGALIAHLSDWVWANADAVLEGATLSVALALVVWSLLSAARRVRAKA